MAVIAIAAGMFALALLWPNPRSDPKQAAVVPSAAPATPVPEPVPAAADPEAEERLFERIRRDRAVPYDRLEVDRGGRRR